MNLQYICRVQHLYKSKNYKEHICEPMENHPQKQNLKSYNVNYYKTQ